MPLALWAGPRSGTDARGPQSKRPLVIVLVLFVVVFGALYGALLFAAYETRSGVRLAVQKGCGLSSTAVAGDLSIDGGDARLPYVDSTGAHRTALVYIGARNKYFLASCGR